MIIVAIHFPSIFSGETLLSQCKRLKTMLQLCNVTSLCLVIMFFFRVTHPDVFVIGLLCVDKVPRGSGSLCLHVYTQVMWEQEKRCNKTTMVGRNRFTGNNSHQ